MHALSIRPLHALGILALLAGFMAAPLAAPVRAAEPTPTPPSPSGEFAEALKDKKLIIAFIPKCSNPIFNLSKKGAQKKAFELSKTGADKVEIVNYTPKDCGDVQGQVENFKKAIEKKAEAIIISCISADACQGMINAAVDIGVPVVTYDTDSPNSKRLTFYGIDNYETGKLAAQVLAEALPDGGDIGILKGNMNDQDVALPRITGFQEGLTDTNLSVATDPECTSDCWDESVALVEAAMKDYPELNGWFFMAPNPIMQGGAKLTLWKAATQKGMKTVAYDAMQQELDWVRSGKLYAVVDQPYWGWGYDTVQIVYDHMVNGKTFEKNTYVMSNVITKKNVDAAQKMWKTGDFSQPLPPYK